MSAVIWLTGLSGAGKTTLGRQLEQQLQHKGQACALLDGDVIRRGLSNNLGFSAADRAENVRRVAEVASLMADAGITVIVTLISPSAQERASARRSIGAGRFFEVFVNAPLTTVEKRDVKGLYALARAGRIRNFTGIDAVYEAPPAPALTLYTDRESEAESASRLIAAVLDWQASRAGH